MFIEGRLVQETERRQCGGCLKAPDNKRAGLKAPEGRYVGA